MDFTQPVDLARRVGRASRRYAATIKYGRNPPRGDGDVREQAQRFEQAMVWREMRLAVVRRVLERLDILPYQQWHYLNFAKRVDKLARNFEALALRMQVGHAVDRWTDLGCDRGVLRSICREVFEIAVEGPGTGIREQVTGKEEITIEDRKSEIEYPAAVPARKDEGQRPKDEAGGKDEVGP